MTLVDVFVQKEMNDELYFFDSLDSISRWRNKVSYGKIWRFYSKIQEARKKRTINVNPRLLLDSLVTEFEAMLLRSDY